MPSRSRIFSLPKLRSRSRSVARPTGGKGAAAKKPGDGDGNDHQHQQQRGTKTAPQAAPRGRAVSPNPSKAGATTTAAGATSASNFGYTNKSPTPTATPNTSGTDITSKTTSLSVDDYDRGAPLTPSALSRGTTDDSALSYDDEFTSAFTRSPPSFDKFDSDILSEDAGVFPQANPNSFNSSANNGGGGGISNPVERYHYEIMTMGQEDLDENSSAMVYSRDCTEESEDPPAILMLDDDDELHMDDEHDVDHEDENFVNDRLDTINRTADGNGGEDPINNGWFDPSSFRDSKNRRLVSPDPSPEKKQLEAVTSNSGSFNKDDNFATWGAPDSNFDSSSDDVFGTNFFTSFDGDKDENDDGFGAVTKGNEGEGERDDPFSFGNSWTDINASTSQGNTGAGQGNDGSEKKRELQQGFGNSNEGNDPWGETSFVSGSFNYSMSNEESIPNRQGQQPIEEKKNDDNQQSRIDPPPAAAAAPQAAVVWDSQADDRDAPSPHPLHPLQTQSQEPIPQHSKSNHHLRQLSSNSTSSQQHNVVVTFENSLSRPPSIIDERKVSHGTNSHLTFSASSTIPSPSQSHRNLHRRLNSNGSQSSRKSQPSNLSNSQRRSKKGGGSVSSNRSNSSAVDQILEHYRNKRRGTLGGAGSSSVHSGSQFSTTGSSPGSNAPGGGAANSTGVRSTVVARGGSVGSSHRRNPSNESVSRHRRNPSNESVSRIIDNLESTAAVAPKVGSAHRRIPSPVTGPVTGTGHRRIPSPVTGPVAGTGMYYPSNGPNGYPGSADAATRPIATDVVESTSDEIADNQFLMANIEATIGPRGVAPDMQSLNGRGRSSPLLGQSRSGGQQSNHGSNTSSRSSRPNRSPSRSRSKRSDRSVESRTSRASRASRNSFRTYQSTRSALTTMSKETQSVANDLFRLEAQLADQVARQRQEEGGKSSNGSVSLAGSASLENIQYSTSGEFGNGGANNNSPLGAEPVPRGPAPFAIVAPPGKLGILLSNSKSHPKRGGAASSTGPTHVSAVRSESVLAGKVHVGDVFVSIDGEDVTHLNSKEITNVMARKSEFERVLRFRPLVASVREEWI